MARRRRKSDAYERVPVQGVTLNKRTEAALLTAQARPKTDNEWTVFQGSYNAGGVGASAGTHDGGGAVDLSPFNWQQRVHALRAVGFAAWHRPELFDANGNRVWGEHIHAILIGDREMSQSAANQVVQYRNHQDGLAAAGPDKTWHPAPIPVFDYSAYVRERNRVRARAQRAAAWVRRAVAALIRARKNTDDPKKKQLIQDAIARIRHTH